MKCIMEEKDIFSAVIVRACVISALAAVLQNI